MTDIRVGDIWTYNWSGPGGGAQNRVDHVTRSDVELTILTGPNSPGKRTWPIAMFRKDFTPMAQPFFPSVGDKVRLPTWEADRYVDVEWVGDKTFAGIRSSDGVRTTYSCNAIEWQLWVKKVQRYEHRAPLKGERFFINTQMDGHLAPDGTVMTCPSSDFTNGTPRFVLVDE